MGWQTVLLVVVWLVGSLAKGARVNAIALATLCWWHWRDWMSGVGWMDATWFDPVGAIREIYSNLIWWLRILSYLMFPVSFCFNAVIHKIRHDYAELYLFAVDCWPSCWFQRRWQMEYWMNNDWFEGGFICFSLFLCQFIAMWKK